MPDPLSLSIRHLLHLMSVSVTLKVRCRPAAADAAGKKWGQNGPSQTKHTQNISTLKYQNIKTTVSQWIGTNV